MIDPDLEHLWVSTPMRLERFLTKTESELGDDPGVVDCEMFPHHWEEGGDFEPVQGEVKRRSS